NISISSLERSGTNVGRFVYRYGTIVVRYALIDSTIGCENIEILGVQNLIIGVFIKDPARLPFNAADHVEDVIGFYTFSTNDRLGDLGLCLDSISHFRWSIRLTIGKVDVCRV